MYVIVELLESQAPITGLGEVTLSVAGVAKLVVAEVDEVHPVTVLLMVYVKV